MGSTNPSTLNSTCLVTGRNAERNFNMNSKYILFTKVGTITFDFDLQKPAESKCDNVQTLSTMLNSCPTYADWTLWCREIAPWLGIKSSETSKIINDHLKKVRPELVALKSV
jgi:hypothetical protein